MSKILILESSKNVRGLFAEAVARGRIKDATIVSSVDEAIDALKKGGVEVFRTNFINDDLSFATGRFYSRPAIEEALDSGIKVEIGTVTDQDEINGYLRKFGQANLVNLVTVVQKWGKDGRLSVPGESETPTKNERL